MFETVIDKDIISRVNKDSISYISSKERREGISYLRCQLPPAYDTVEMDYVYRQENPNWAILEDFELYKQSIINSYLTGYSYLCMLIDSEQEINYIKLGLQVFSDGKQTIAYIPINKAPLFCFLSYMKVSNTKLPEYIKTLTNKGTFATKENPAIDCIEWIDNCKIVIKTFTREVDNILKELK